MDTESLDARASRGEAKSDELACVIDKVNVAFRTDSGPHIGTGHLVRCLTLGHELRGRGADVTFFCRDHHGAASDLIRAMAFGIVELPTRRGQPALSDPFTWSGATDSEDAAQLLQKLPSPPDWVIVDHYSLGDDWESLVRPHCRRLAVIDDLARGHECDLLIDPNWHGPAMAGRYAGRLNAGATALLGPDFAFLDPRFHARRVSPIDRRLPVNRVLVYFGGSNLYDLSALTLTVLKLPEFRDLQVDVVIGATTANRDSVSGYAAQRPRVTIHEHQPCLAPLLAKADIAIGGVGGTTWERMCLGVPTLAAIIADNQAESAQRLSDAGLLLLLGRAADVTAESMAAGLRSLLHDPAQRQRMADAGQALVDGRGIDRIADTMWALS